MHYTLILALTNMGINMDLPVMLPEQLGPYLKAIRLSQGLTQVQLAQRLGLSQTRIVEIEKAPGRIRVVQLSSGPIQCCIRCRHGWCSKTHGQNYLHR